jgi:GTP-binding protein
MSIPINQAYRQATFLQSASSITNCPPDKGIEIVFVGRSNAGKSSALNTLTDQKKLARTSKTPGRTQLINFFSLNESKRLVDLPGYGYAKVSRSTRDAWEKMIDRYLAERESIGGIIHIMDARHPLQEFDIHMIEWAAYETMPLHILLTKADKLKQNAAKESLLSVENAISDHPNLFSAQLFSSLNKKGLDALCNKLDEWFHP